MSVHESIAALPVLTDADKALIRAMCTRRFAYCLASDESAGSLYVVDPDTNIVPLYLAQNGILYAYDPLDSTTSPSATCLVSADNKRFKSDAPTYPWSVLTRSTSAQPASPADGARYLVPTAATGIDWAGQDGKVAIYAGERWHFVVIPVGRGLYVEDEDTRYYRNASGVWTAGMGVVTLGTGTVKPSALIGGGAKLIWPIENQTTNTPPASVTNGVAYIVGSSPTGAWVGHTGKIAHGEGGAWIIHTPANGWFAYDKSLNNYYRFTGTAWVSQGGAIIAALKQFTESGSHTTGGSGSFGYSINIPPASTYLYIEDSVTISHTARASGRRLRFTYRFDCDVGHTCILALFRDSEVSARDWCRFVATSANTFVLETTSSDALPHAYKIRVIAASANGVPTALYRRLFSVEEFA